MLEIIIIAVIVYFIVKTLNKSKKASGTKTTPIQPTTPAKKPTTSTPPAKKPATPTSSAPKKADSSDPFSGIDMSAFSDAFAAMEGKPVSGGGSSVPASNEAEDRKWVREHSFTETICDFYGRSWGPTGKIYEKVNNGELPIVRLVVTVTATGMQEKLYLKDGGDFDSETTFESFKTDDCYPTLDTAAKRDELFKCISERLQTLPTISVKADGFHILTGVSTPKPEEPKKPSEEFASASGFGSVDSAFAGFSADDFTKAFSQMGGEAPKAEEPKPEPPKRSEPEDGPAADPETFKAISVRVMGYYDSMWNKESGALYTELDSSMPIDHFTFQVKETCLVESVWLIGDDIPLVTETSFEKLCAGLSLSSTALKNSKDRATLQNIITTYLVDEIGTVTLRGGDFYPIRK